MSNQPTDAGIITVEFHYGSRHDQMIDWFGSRKYNNVPERDKRHEKLLKCSKIISFICDDCFEKHANLFDGYEVKTTITESKVV